LAAGEISHRVGIPATTLSFHLSQLSRAGLVSSRREGRSIIYRADYASMLDLMEFLMKNCCQDETSAQETVATPVTLQVKR
jgi:DNA-binding transcriptional ArsR family regulator